MAASARPLRRRARPYVQGSARPAGLREGRRQRRTPITGEQLSQLLREHRIPIAVLNACQSAMLSAEAEDAFASVATSLLRAGVRSVVAMGYSLYVSGAQEFLPAFYRRLFRTGSVAEATRGGAPGDAGAAAQRARARIELQDWLVPVLYQQDPLQLDFARQARSAAQAVGHRDPRGGAARGQRDAPHGVIGRDSAVLALERASRRAPAGLLVHGLGGRGQDHAGARLHRVAGAHPGPAAEGDLADLR